MKVMIVFGTRPEIIRLARVIPRLDELCDQVVVHTGQNFDPKLNEIFFQDLGLRAPQHYLDARGSLGAQASVIFAQCEKLMVQEKPERFLVLGDTNSALAALVAKRLAVPVFHMEAGNRCFDDRVPEEVNRRVIDHCSDVLMPYTERSRQNLLREGIPSQRIVVTGNPIYEVVNHYQANIDSSTIQSRLGLIRNQYFLVTMHRAENVDLEERLRAFTSGLDRLQRAYGLPVIVSTHPRTRARMQAAGFANGNPEIRYLEPFGFFDFISLEKHCLCVLTDSGTVQEECAIFGIPNVTIRDVTERPETIEGGTNILSGADPESLLLCVRMALSRPGPGQAPREYLVENVSETVAHVILGYHCRQS